MRRHTAMRPTVRPTLALLLLATVVGCSFIDKHTGGDAPPETVFGDVETAVAYEPRVEGAPNDEIEAKLVESLGLWRRQEQGAASLALLRRRAIADIDMADRVLRAFGYYRASVTVDVARADDPDAPATAMVKIAPGPVFTLAQHRFTISDGASPPEQALDPAGFGSPVGAPAVGEAILAAEMGAVADLRATGRPWARSEGRRVVANLENATLDVESFLALGPEAVYGPVTFENLTDVEEAYLLSYQPWEDGDPIDTRQLATFQERLLATDLFAIGAVDLPDEPPVNGDAPVVAPVNVTLETRPFRSVSAGLRVDTDVGPEARLGLEHRNLFGANEQGSATLQGGLLEQRFDLGFRKPQFRRDGQDLTSALSLRRMEDEAFDELGATFQLGVERELSPQWSVGVGGLVELAQIDEDDKNVDSLLLGAPAFARYDGSDDALNPTDGARLQIAATPFAGSVDGDFAPFLLLDAQTSGYLPLSDDRAFVLAGRARLGGILSDAFDDAPANRRLFAGGGGSVRGYQDRFVGPLDEDDEPIGGRSVVELGAELRARFRETMIGDVGGVAFVDAGSVSTEVAPNFDDGLQAGAGLGFRYFTPVGPIRADIAFPLDPREADPSFQVYFSIGQAF